MHKWSHVFVLGLLAVSFEVKSEQSAHEHGVAKVMLVSEGTSISLQFESPAMNIAGFEHKPRSKEQKKALEQALKKLNKPQTLMALKGGECRFSSVDLENPFENDGRDEHKHDDHKHGHDKYDHDEDKHGHDKHEHDEDKHEHDEHKHAEQDAGEHREFVAQYQVQCKKIAELEAIEFLLMEEFTGIEKLEVQYILSGKQGAVSLSRQSSTLKIAE